MEKSFSAIGTAVCVGSGVGGVYGIYDGVRQTALSQLSGILCTGLILRSWLVY